MRVAIHSIQKTLFDGEAEKLIAYTPQGQITILDHHLPLVTRLTGPGVETVDKEGTRNIISFVSGFLEVRPGSTALILAEVKS